MLKIHEKILRLIFPDRCILCNRVIRGGAVCGECEGKLRLLRGVRTCKKCSRPIAEDVILCRDCLVHPRHFTACFSAAVYSDELRRSVLRFKFYKRPDFYRGYARLILSHLSAFDALPQLDAVIGVPLSRERFAERGYQQAVLIAREVAKGLGLPLLKKAVIKVRHTPAQSSLPYHKRLENLRGAFRVADKGAVKGKTILLVDDVFTTGTTADEISKTLLRAGAAEVYVATVAVTELK